MQFYIVHTQTGYEDRVKAHLEKAVQGLGLDGKIGRILVPMEEVVEIRKNKRVLKKRKFFPGYVLVEMDIENQTYWLIRNTPGVTGFLGGPRPTALPEHEAKTMIELATAPPAAKPKSAIVFEPDESVRITEGPFTNFIGVIDEVNEEKGKLRAMVTIFGRQTPVELDFLQVEKI